MKTILRSAGAIPVAAAISLLGAATTGTAFAQSSPPATHALQYLSSIQQANGSLPGFSPVGETEDFVIGATANGYDPATLGAGGGCSTAVQFLAAAASSGTTLNDQHGNTVPAAVAKLILAVVDAGYSPRSFGAPLSVDLLSKLQGTYQAGSGSFGTANFAFDQSLALLALTAANTPSFPVPAHSVDYLVSLQGADGGFGYGTSDTNSTAMALMALAAAGRTTGQAAAISYLHAQQAAMGNGGFAFASGNGAFTDPDSDALAMQAITAIGQDPTGSAWTVGGGTPRTDLLTFQDPATGGFSGQLPRASNPPDAFTTSEVPTGLAQAAFPVTPSYTPGATYPGSACTRAATAAAPAPSPTVGAGTSPSSVAGAPQPGPSPILLATTGGGPLHGVGRRSPWLELGLAAVGAALLSLVLGRRRQRQ